MNDYQALFKLFNALNTVMLPWTAVVFVRRVRNSLGSSAIRVLQVRERVACSCCRERATRNERETPFKSVQSVREYGQGG